MTISMSFENYSADIVIPLYNNWSALVALSSEIERWLDVYPLLNVFVIDDGSSEPGFEWPPVFSGNSRLTLIRHMKNRGRASARNTGFRAGNSEFVIFLDVDCVPQDGWLDHFFWGAQSGANCIFGNLRADGRSYWSRYLNELYAKKASAYLKGSRDFNTPFCMFRRELLDRIGGFSEEYTRYGFEDRDLIQNLIKSFGISPLFLADVYATHSPPTSVEAVLTKASESGAYSAKVFSQRFPACYRKTGYWYFDAREHSVAYCFPLSVLWLSIDKNVFALKKLMDNEFLPYLVWKSLVKVSSALAFFHGTTGALR
ncbi:glycosyltransferase family 2 protein [Marinobacter sp. F3R11]|uniref:glycosyltransferase family 2 protein n=1 Tax=Marinobacter sp. F3R11 TaxID=2267231 RepID=UPI0016515E39|nr:glycosyltransferase [Marinobacter sp. F3R11]